MFCQTRPPRLVNCTDALTEISVECLSQGQYSNMPCASTEPVNNISMIISALSTGQLMASHQSGCNALVFLERCASYLNTSGIETCTLHTPSLSPVVLVGMTINAIYNTAYAMSNKHLFEKIVVTLQLSVAKLS